MSPSPIPPIRAASIRSSPAGSTVTACEFNLSGEPLPGLKASGAATFLHAVVDEGLQCPARKSGSDLLGAPRRVYSVESRAISSTGAICADCRSARAIIMRARAEATLAQCLWLHARAAANARRLARLSLRRALEARCEREPISPTGRISPPAARSIAASRARSRRHCRANISRASDWRALECEPEGSRSSRRPWTASLQARSSRDAHHSPALTRERRADQHEAGAGRASPARRAPADRRSCRR